MTHTKDNTCCEKGVKLDDIIRDKPFNINKRFKNGNLKDCTTFIFDEHRRIRIWFRDLEKWVNPPNDTNQSYRIAKDIEKYGIVYCDNTPLGTSDEEMKKQFLSQWGETFYKDRISAQEVWDIVKKATKAVRADERERAMYELKSELYERMFEEPYAPGVNYSLGVINRILTNKEGGNEV